MPWRNAAQPGETHDPSCQDCEHDCPWNGNPIGAPFCSICDDHMEAIGDDPSAFDEGADCGNAARELELGNF